MKHSIRTKSFDFGGNMEKQLFKKITLLLVIAFILLLIVLNFSYIANSVKGFVVVLQPILLGAVIAFVLNKPMRTLNNIYLRITKNRISEKSASSLSLITTYLSFFILIAALLTFVLPQLSESVQLLYDNMDEYLSNSQDKLDQLVEFLRLEQLELRDLKTIISDLPEAVNNAFSGILPGVFNFATGLIGSIVNIVLGLIISIYILSDKKHLLVQMNKILDAYMKSNSKDTFIRVIKLSNDTFSNFVVGQLTEAMILSILTFIGMLIFGFEYALLISVMIGITSIIPIVGAFIGLIPSTFILLIVNPSQAFWFLIFIIVLMQIEGNFIYPKVVGGSIGLPALWVLSALIIGGGLFGILGMLIGIPFTSIIYHLLKSNVNSRLEIQ